MVQERVLVEGRRGLKGGSGKGILKGKGERRRRGGDGEERRGR